MGNYTNEQRLNYLRQSFTDNIDKYNKTNFKFTNKVPFAISFDELKSVETIEQISLFIECLKEIFSDNHIELSIIQDSIGKDLIESKCNEHTLFWQLEGRSCITSSGSLKVTEVNAGDLIYLTNDSEYTIQPEMPIAIALFKIKYPWQESNLRRLA
jgi:hypothetical protein